MKNNFTIILFLCLTITYAQKVKVKKDILAIEKNEVAIFIEEERNQYQLQTLDGSPLMGITFESKKVGTLEGDETFEFLKITKPDSDEVYYSDYDRSTFKSSFNGTTSLVRHLIVNNKFLSENGIDQKNIDTFFSQPRPQSSAITDAEATYAEAFESVIDFDLKLDKNKIYKGGDSNVLVGSYGFKEIPNMNITSIKVFDATGLLVGTHSGSTIMLFDGNKIKFNAYSNNNQENAKKVIERMIIAGYTLGDMKAVKAEIRSDQRKEDVAEELETSSNIYDQKATLYDEDGSALEGTVKLEFKELETSKSGMSSLNNYGGVVTLTTVKENGKNKYEDYKAKDGVRFCLTDSNVCYQGISTKGMTAAKFNEEIAVDGNLKLYKSVSFTYYVIKKENEKKGLIVSKSSLFKADNSEKMFEDIFEYLEDCPDLKNNINSSEIDLDKESDLMILLQAYNSCK